MNEPTMGRVDVLFELLREADLDTPDAVSRFIPKLDPDTETRPLADQIADAILSERPELYETFLALKARASSRDPYSQAVSGEHGPTLLGEFLTRWVVFERFARHLARLNDVPTQPVPSNKAIQSLLGEHRIPIKIIDHLRYVRNSLVHGHRQSSTDLLRSSIDEFDTVFEALEQSGDANIVEALKWARSEAEDRPGSLLSQRAAAF
jgi:hypothetical protein